MRLSLKHKRAIIARMIELLDAPYGWTQGVWKRPNARSKNGTGASFCLLGAAQQAYTDVTGLTAPDGTSIAQELSITTLLRAKRGSGHVISFNDDKSTKKADVIGLLREKEAELA